MVTFSNPRLHAVIENWPSGRKRVTAYFAVIEDKRRMQRVEKATTGKPKYTVYYRKIRLATGSDGKIYCIGLTEYNQLVIMPGTLKFPEYLTQADDPNRYSEIYNLIWNAK